MSIRKCVVISCVSFETAMIVEPAVSYGADEIHLFHYIRDPDSDNGRIYAEFYDEVCSQIRAKLPRIKIVEHADSPIYDFQLMFRDILNVISEIRERPAEPKGDRDAFVGPDSDIFINASAGTSEFSAAAIIASMMSKGVNSFTVGTREFTIKNDEIRNLYYRGGKPVGLTEHTHAPKIIPNFEVETPEENQIRALRTYYRRSQEGRSLSATNVIMQLKEDGIWSYTASPKDLKTDLKQKETMYYQRHYLGTWLKKGWIEKPAGYGKYRLTDNGIIVIQTFYTD